MTTRREQLNAVIDAAILAHAEDKTGRYLHDFIGDALDRFTSQEREPVVVERPAVSVPLDEKPIATETLQCFACGKEAEAYVQPAGWGPIRCTCGGVMLHKPDAQTTERREKP